MENIVEMRGIRKSFSGVEVLHGVDFEIRKGEVLGLVGENGAGKSTLMNILMGSLPQTAGEIYINGKLQKEYNVNVALREGVTMIPQELALIPAVTVAENIMLSQRSTNRFRMISWKKMYQEAQSHIDKMGFKINAYSRLDNLPIAYRQLVAIIRAISENQQVIIMDEPTSSLSHEEVLHLHGVIHQLKERGTTIVYIGHLMSEIFAICDRITVLRDGNLIDTKVTSETNEREIVSLMVGEQLHEVQDKLLHRKKEKTDHQKNILSVRGLQRNKNTGELSFDLKEGEILGITGLVGAGKTELIRNLFGLEKYIKGEVELYGKPVKFNHPIAAIAHSMMLVPEDRKIEGLVLPGSVLENITLVQTYRKRTGFLGFIRNFKREREDSKHYVENLSIRTSGLEQRVRNLSGGNQQKVVLSKALITNPRILVLDEPTRGIDVGAKAMIYQLIRGLRDEGMSILFVSSDVTEVPLVCDRLLVMRDYHFVAELEAEAITANNIINSIAGGKVNGQK